MVLSPGGHIADTIHKSQEFVLDKIWPQLNEVTYFDNVMADAIIKFVIANRGVDHMIVHCETGIARSPAIAAAISEHCNIPHTIFQQYCPNTMVFSILRTRFGFNRE